MKCDVCMDEPARVKFSGTVIGRIGDEIIELPACFLLGKRCFEKLCDNANGDQT